MPEASKIRPSRMRAWLQLMRIANLPTAISNVAAGAALASQLNGYDLALVCNWLFTIAPVSCLMYIGGMILNDAFDAESDAKDCPTRPIPSGTITRQTAFVVGFGYLLMGLLLSFVATFAAPFAGLQPLVIAISLSALIVLYDGILKRTGFAPLTMGACRSFNVLLGASYGMIAFTASQSSFINYRLLTYAVLIGLFVTGITLLARAERDQRQSRAKLMIAGFVMAVSLIGIASLPWISDSLSWFTELKIQDSATTSQTKNIYSLMVAAISLPILLRVVRAVRLATPKAIGKAIVASLTSLIFVDAAVCFLAMPKHPILAAAVALLIVPAIILRLFSKQT